MNDRNPEIDTRLMQELEMITGLDAGILLVPIPTVNASSPESLRALRSVADALKLHRTDPSVQSVVLVGGAESLDLACRSTDDAMVAAAVAEILEWIVHILGDVACPVVAVFDGVVAEVGLPLVSACDLVVASDSSEFVLARRPGWEPCTRIAAAALAKQIGRARALKMLATAQTLSAHDAHRYGLVSAVSPRTEFVRTVIDLVRRPRDTRHRYGTSEL